MAEEKTTIEKTEGATPSAPVDETLAQKAESAIDKASEEAKEAVEELAKEHRKPNKLARWAFGLALASWALFILSAFLPLASWALFILSAFLPLAASWWFGPLAGLIALVAFVMGLVSLRKPPRNLATGALVFSGVIIIIFVIIFIVAHMIKNL
ncbi:MAG: hypothetical protein LUC85_07510 [Bacteroidales bacterium]|nr:hypothetical protein [Bacteroidales bacterium]